MDSSSKPGGGFGIFFAFLCDVWFRTACLPRTPLLKSYSGRILSLSSDRFRLFCFFMAFPFSAALAIGHAEASGFCEPRGPGATSPRNAPHESPCQVPRLRQAILLSPASARKLFLPWPLLVRGE